MDKVTKRLFALILVLFISLISPCIAGLFIHIKSFLESFVDMQDLEEIKRLTSEEEGFCLTDLIEEYNVNYYSMMELYKEACVSIVINVNNRDSFLGSGVCVASKGYEYAEDCFIENGSFIITNYHVIASIYNNSGSNNFIKVLPNQYYNTSRYESEYYETEVLWYDNYLDQAVLYVNQNIDWVRLKDRVFSCDENEKFYDYERAFTIGTPKILNNHNTISNGRIRNNDDCIDYSYTMVNDVINNIYEDLISIQIPIINGNSGGGVFDADGYVIGQATLGVGDNSESAYAINYAVNIYPITIILSDLVKTKIENVERKRYSLNNLGLLVVDADSSDVMSYTRETYGQIKKYYQQDVLSSDLVFYQEGVKILQSNLDIFEKDDIIIGVKRGDVTKNVSSRNDLIYQLLQCGEGETVEFVMKEDENIIYTFA